MLSMRRRLRFAIGVVLGARKNREEIEEAKEKEDHDRLVLAASVGEKRRR